MGIDHEQLTFPLQWARHYADGCAGKVFRRVDCVMAAGELDLYGLNRGECFAGNIALTDTWPWSVALCRTTCGSRGEGNIHKIPFSAVLLFSRTSKVELA